RRGGRSGLRRVERRRGGVVLGQDVGDGLAEVFALPDARGPRERLEGLEALPGEAEDDRRQTWAGVGDIHTLIHIFLRIAPASNSWVREPPRPVCYLHSTLH